jgi:DNA-binding transcriptional ArsR family regulator
MSKYKTELPERFADIFKALSNPHRLSIFLRLMSCCPPGTRLSNEKEARRLVGQLGRDLCIVPSTVSHHIKELRRAGLIKVERTGKHVECWVDAETVRIITDLFTGRTMDTFPSECHCRQEGSHEEKGVCP